MTTPASMSELSTTAASNNPAGSDAPSTLDDQIRALAAIVRQNVTKGADIASASAITIPASGNYFVVTGTTGITSITDTNSWYGREVVLKFSGALTITHSSSLILPGATNIITGAGDVLGFVSESSGVWRCSSINSGIKRFSKGADVASASALTLGTDGNYFDITGTTAITSIGTLGVGTWVKLHFDEALTLTHHATDLILPGGANITTAAGDEAEFVEYASGDWRCTNYVPAAFVPSIVAQATAEAGTDTAPRLWTAERVAQAIAALGGGGVTSGTVVNTSTGATSYTVTGIPSGAKFISFGYGGISTNGTSSVMIRVGPSGGVVNAGYAGALFDNTTATQPTDGFYIDNFGAAAAVRHGRGTLQLIDASTNTWSWRSEVLSSDSNRAERTASGTISLAGALERFQIIANGTDTFDAGKLNYLILE